MRILVTSLFATLALASTAQAHDTHGCSTKVDKLPVQVVATTNIACRAAVPFMQGYIGDGTICAAISKNRRCVNRYRKYLCASRFKVSSTDVILSIHCMKGPSRRIGLTFSWAEWSRANGRG